MIGVFSHPSVCWRGILRDFPVLLLVVLFALSPTPVFADRSSPGATVPPEIQGNHSTTGKPGYLRVLYTLQGPRERAISRTEQLMLERYAAEQDLELQWIESPAEWNLLSMLDRGKGDVIVGQHKSLLSGMTGQARFTLPWTTSRQQVVARTDTTQVNDISDLAHRQVALKKSSPAWPVMQHLMQDNQTMDLVVIPESLTAGEVMQRVNRGQYDVTIADSDFLKQYLPAHPELSAVYDLDSSQARVWFVQNSNEQLQTSLNQFLNRNHLEFNITQIYLDDLPAIKERRLLRLITYNDHTNYYLDDGGLHGFEYELIRKFARNNSMRVDVVLANSHEEMEKMLVEGEGDIIAAGLPKSSIDNQAVRFSGTYNFSTPLVVGRNTDYPLLDLRDLEGRRITLPAESPYLAQLLAIRDRGIDVDIRIADYGVDTETTLAMVSRGMFDLTVIDSNKYTDKLSDKYRVRVHFPLSEPVAHGWAVRAGDEKLLSALNQYIDTTYRSRFYNTLYTQYIEHPSDSRENVRLVANLDKLSPYDDLVRQYAREYDFDWRLIVAQMYQESRFNPKAISDAGAEGLMQLLPTTAEDLGIADLADPALNIKAGVRYLSLLRDQFETDLLLGERTWFSLASYNAGFARINHARKLAREMGLDPNRWFDNVERAMLVLAQPLEKDGESVRACRCGETVAYVHEIRALYNNYVRLTQSLQVALNHNRPVSEPGKYWHQVN